MRSKQDESDKLVMSFLSKKGFQIKGYLGYGDHSVIIGQFRPIPPLTVPVRTFVEVSRILPNAQVMDGLFSQAKNAECNAVVLAVEKPEKLDNETLSLVSKYRIELWSLENIRQELEGADLSKALATLEAVSPSRLIKALSDLAKQQIPSDISFAINDPKRKAWEVFEDAVVATFKSGFGYKVKQYGKESLFESEPEGLVVTTPPDPKNRFAFIYDCKSAADKYTVDSGDESKYIDYIEDKKSEALSLEKCELKYFLIISPAFGGDLKSRRQTIFQRTQVMTAFVAASVLKEFAEWMDSIEDPDIKRLVDLKDIIKLDEPEISQRTIRSYTEKFDRAYKPRY